LIDLSENFQRLSRRQIKYISYFKNAEAGTAPFDVSNNTKQALRPANSISVVISNYKDCSCTLACPAGGPPRRMIFFGTFLHQGKKVHQATLGKQKIRMMTGSIKN